MKLYYYKDPVGNFGDDMNPWLWPQLFPAPLEQCFDDETLFVGIGSILNHKIPEQPAQKIVFGSGHGYGSLPAVTDDWRFFCVRGPRTAKVLELPEELAISDSAMLVRQVVEPAQSVEHRVSFMPHHLTVNYDDWRSVCDSLSIQYIDPAASVESTLAIIRTSGVVITEAMHGAIVADALRVPWIPVRTRPYIQEFKWQDWSDSVGIEHAFEWLPPVWNPNIDTELKKALHPFAAFGGAQRLRWLARFGKRRLSTDATFQHVYDRLLESFDRLLDAASPAAVSSPGADTHTIENILCR